MEDELYNALEKLNMEKANIRNSKEYKIGNAIKENMNLMFKLKIKKLITNLKNKKAKKKIDKVYCNPDNFEYTENNVDYKHAKIAVYTCIIGNYDNIQIPLIKFENVDYFILTDDIGKYEKYRDYYNIVEIPNKILEKSKIEANRYVKFHPSEYFKEYDFSIYLDGNVRIISDIRTFVKRCSDKTGIAMHTHRERNDIYDEAKVCKLLRRGNSTNIQKQMELYKKEEFPERFGMNEATIIVSDLHNNESVKLLDEWYKEFIRSGSLRDQLAWPYVLWKNNYKITDVGILGNNIYENYKIEMVRHN